MVLLFSNLAKFVEKIRLNMLTFNCVDDIFFNSTHFYALNFKFSFLLDEGYIKMHLFVILLDPDTQS